VPEGDGEKKEGENEQTVSLQASDINEKSRQQQKDGP
jgi:hypothetical protein